jgi:hypothetical protein
MQQREPQPEEQPAIQKQLRSRFLEYGSLILILMKLYFQGRMLMAQNYILSCRLRMWDAVFVYFKIQIFLIRLANGFPLDQCWPTERSLPPITD